MTAAGTTRPATSTTFTAMMFETIKVVTKTAVISGNQRYEFLLTWLPGEIHCFDKSSRRSCLLQSSPLLPGFGCFGMFGFDRDPDATPHLEDSGYFQPMGV